MDRFLLRVAVYVALIKGNEILLARRCNTDFYDGFYNLPSGHLDGGEKASIAAIREAKEEVGVIISKNDLNLVHTMHRHRIANDGEYEYIDLIFQAKKWSNKPKNCERKWCDDLSWFKLNNLPKNIVPYNKKFLEARIKNTNYSEKGFN